MGKKIQCIGRYTLAGCVLGKGNFARVELATHDVTGCKVAIKIIDMRKIKEEYLKQNVNREAMILGQLRHPNIIRLYETMKATTLYCLVTEYAAGRDILSFLKSHKEHRLSEDRARPFTRQIVSAVHYLHERGVCHRDLKMENIMLDENKKSIKIVDFGLSNTFTMDELMKTHCGSPEYAAPELFSAGGKYGPEVDIWAIGIILYAMLVGKLPFTTVYTDQYRRIKLLKQIEKGIQHEQEQEMLHLTPECRDLIRSIIEPKPEIRLPMLDIEIHPWITEGSKTPFFPFVAMPRDKALKSQTRHVIEELSTALSMKKEQIETTVHENKSDEISAMFNMLLHKKRIESGVYDIDHTLKCNQGVESKGKKKRSKSAHTEKDGGKKSKNKVPPELVLPKEVPVDKNQHSAGSKEPGSAGHETKFSSFDFLALCSTPTWLGPERRRSRRRSRSPGPTSPAPHADTPRYCLAPLPLTDSQGKMVDSPQGKNNLLSPDAAYSAKNSVPQSQNSPSLRRASSLRYSKRRNRSGSIGSKRKTFGRSSSVDVPCANVSTVEKVLPVQTPKSPVQRPANLILQGCYPNKISDGKAVVGATNGPLTSVEVHFSDNLNPCSSPDLPKKCNAPPPQTHLELPTLESSQVMHSKNLTNNELEMNDSTCVVRPKNIVAHPKNKMPPKKPPRNFLLVSDALRDDEDIEDDAAMQISGYSLSQDSDKDFCRSSPERTDLVRDIEQELSDLRLLEMEECEDRVDSMVELLGGKRSRHSGKDNSNSHIKMMDLHLNTHQNGCSKSERKQSIAAASCDSNADVIELLDNESTTYRNPVESSNSSQTRPVGAKLKTPTTPTWMLLKTPLARIESFHSDDFEFYSSDQADKGGDNASNSPNSANTPTVPCFSYKLNLGKKKPPKLKCKGKAVEKNKSVSNHIGIKDQQSSVCRLEPVVTDPLLSSGSETEHHEDSTDRISSTGKAKIHPMDMEEQESDLKGSKLQKSAAVGNKCENRTSSHSNAITKQPIQIQNSVNRIKNVTNQDSKKKGDHIKSSPWKRSFAQFLRKKRPVRTPSNNNNNDSSTNQIAGRNGHTPNSPINKSETNIDEDHSKYSESRWILAPNNSIGNNIISEIELQSSSLPARSPSPTPRVFDFSVINDSPKGKSCLLSWRTCRDCGMSEASSEEESEAGIPLEQNVHMNVKSTTEVNNIQESSLTAYQFAPT